MGMNQDMTAEGSGSHSADSGGRHANHRPWRADAALALCLASTEQKNRALRAAAASLRARRHKIIAAMTGICGRRRRRTTRRRCSTG